MKLNLTYVYRIIINNNDNFSRDKRKEICYVMLILLLLLYNPMLNNLTLKSELF